MGYAFIWGIKLWKRNLIARGNIADDPSNNNYVHNISDPKVLSAAVLGM